MNWTEVLLAGLGGGVGGGFGGGLGALLGVVLKDKVRKESVSALTAALAVGLGLVGANLGRDQRVRDWLSPPTRLEVALRKREPQIKASSALRARLEQAGAKGSQQAGAELSHAGLKRLPIADLRRWNTLRQALANGSSEVCTGLWTGKMETKTLLAVMEEWPEKDLDDWAQISTDAMRLEAEAAPVPVDKDGFSKGLRALLQTLPPDETTRLQTAFRGGIGLPSDEACWAMRVVMRGAETLQPPDRDLLLRGLASL
jgi:hypothetical protein